jgi:hypothetical protein
MSKNSKNRNKLAVAKQWSAQRKQGRKGSASTTKKTKKVNVWWKKSAEERAKMKKKLNPEEPAS